MATNYLNVNKPYSILATESDYARRIGSLSEQDQANIFGSLPSEKALITAMYNSDLSALESMYADQRATVSGSKIQDTYSLKNKAAATGMLGIGKYQKQIDKYYAEESQKLASSFAQEKTQLAADAASALSDINSQMNEVAAQYAEYSNRLENYILQQYDPSLDPESSSFASDLISKGLIRRNDQGVLEVTDLWKDVMTQWLYSGTFTEGEMSAYGVANDGTVAATEWRRQMLYDEDPELYDFLMKYQGQFKQTSAGLDANYGENYKGEFGRQYWSSQYDEARSNNPGFSWVSKQGMSQSEMQQYVERKNDVASWYSTYPLSTKKVGNRIYADTEQLSNLFKQSIDINGTRYIAKSPRGDKEMYGPLLDTYRMENFNIVTGTNSQASVKSLVESGKLGVGDVFEYEGKMYMITDYDVKSNNVVRGVLLEKA